ncbi:MAG: hypothetical protein ABSH01_08220 [Terriglobia bacterium]|jgi:hypothetical protein
MTKVSRRRVEEALLADRLGLHEDWVERWEQGGKWVEESVAPAGVPPSIRATLGQDRTYKVEDHVRKLEKAGCRRAVLYFCLEQLSPEAAAMREGRRRKLVLGNDGEFNTASGWTEGRKLATREDMEAVRNKAEATRRLIHRHRRELLLVADTNEFRLPTGMVPGPEDADDALSLLEESLSWVASLARAYATPFEKTLLKSKGLLFLTAYVLKYADARKVKERRWMGVKGELAGLASLVTEKKWSPSDLRGKLRRFEKDYPRLHKLLLHKLDELHRFHATGNAIPPARITPFKSPLKIQF